MDHDLERGPERFWRVRAADYDKLYWAKAEDYIQAALRAADLEPDHVVLDVGTGTGILARAARPHVRHVVALDISEAMLSEGDWSGISVVRWDIGDVLFAENTFDRVFARMVFHHILDDIDRAVSRCLDLLRHGGKIVVAEGVPPTDDDDVVAWYAEMFRLKEARRTFLPDTLVRLLEANGFRNVRCDTHYMDEFSVLNWVRNCGLAAHARERIVEEHRRAPGRVKDAYRMRLRGDDCVIRTRNVIVTGEKPTGGHSGGTP